MTSVARDARDPAGRSSGAARHAGRPRSEQADRAILEAALAVFAEHGPQGLCIEAVAARAGVGKATVYRRWPGKEDLLIAALAAIEEPLPEPRGASVREDLAVVLDALRAEAADRRRMRQHALLLGEGEGYPRLLERYVEAVAEPRRAVVRAILRRGVTTGELRENANIEAAVDMLTGAVLARARLGRERFERGWARRIVDELMAGLAAR